MAEGLVLAGRYRLSKQLGAGGMGSVWRAEDLTLGAEVAVKLIDPAFAESPEALARFRREAQAAASIRSTYVVQILDYGIDQQTPFIAMELLKGESLAQRLERLNVLDPVKLAQVLGHVGRALSLAHEHGIVHRDLKPDNIFLVREGEEDVGKVLDFGIARQQDGLANLGGLKTSTGAVLGTPYYMSPEQATGQIVDHHSDIWSFGAIACECLTGRRPFVGESLGALFHSICMAEMPVPSRLAQVPGGFDAWFARATARDKSARFHSIKDAADELRIVCGNAFAHGGDALGAMGHGDTVLAIGTIGSAASAKSLPLEGTFLPSSQTVGTLPKANRTHLALLSLPAFFLAVGGAVGGWYWLQRAAQGTTGIESQATSTAARVVASADATTSPVFPNAVTPPKVGSALATATSADPVVAPVPSLRAVSVNAQLPVLNGTTTHRAAKRSSSTPKPPSTVRSEPPPASPTRELPREQPTTQRTARPPVSEVNAAGI